MVRTFPPSVNFYTSEKTVYRQQIPHAQWDHGYTADLWYSGDGGFQVKALTSDSG